MKINVGSLLIGMLAGWFCTTAGASIIVGQKLIRENKELKTELEKN